MSDLEELERLQERQDALYRAYQESITTDSLILSPEWKVYTAAADEFDAALERFGGVSWLVKQLVRAEQARRIDNVLAAQVSALLLIVKAGGDVRRANLDDRLLTDRLQDTLDARAELATKL